MIAVAIIGLLSSVAIPQYMRFADRARLVEAKALLSALYTSELTFYLEKGTYSTMLDAIGYAPAGNISFNVGFVNPFDGGMGGSCHTTCSSGVVCAASGWTCLGPAMKNMDSKVLSFANNGQFRAEAHSHLRSTDPTGNFTLTIDETKAIQQWPCD
jgi:type IV pilus assembly protein PilA